MSNLSELMKVVVDVMSHQEMPRWTLPKPDEVQRSDRWDFIKGTVNGKDVKYSAYEVVSVDGDRVTRKWTQYVVNETATNGLKELMAVWRDSGMGEFADAVETRYSDDDVDSVYDSFVTPFDRTETVTVEDIKFFSYGTEYINATGLRFHLTSSRPYTNARITNI